MNKLALLLLLIVATSCVEKIIKEPENLISKDQMSAIFYDLTIVTAAKNTNNEILKKNNIEAMDYIYTKHGIDSLQFVESDLYYASNPMIYKEIYQKVENKLKSDTKAIEDARIEKRKQDSTAKIIKPQKLDSIVGIKESKKLDSI